MAAKQLPEVIEDVRRCRTVVDLLARESVLGVDCEGISLSAEGPLHWFKSETLQDMFICSTS